MIKKTATRWHSPENTVTRIRTRTCACGFGIISTVRIPASYHSAAILANQAAGQPTDQRTSGIWRLCPVTLGRPAICSSSGPRWLRLLQTVALPLTTWRLTIPTANLLASSRTEPLPGHRSTARSPPTGVDSPTHPSLRRNGAVSAGRRRRIRWTTGRFPCMILASLVREIDNQETLHV